MTHHQTIPAMALLLATAAPLAAQASLAATLGGAFDSYRPLAGASESRRNFVGTLSADHVFSAGRGRVFYDFGAGNYDSPGDWSYRLHAAGASYRLGGSDSSGRRVTLTGSLASRRNGDAWTSADYTAMGAGINMELHPRTATTLRSGYRADLRRFGDLAALTQAEHRVFASVLSSFRTRTSVILEGQLGAKTYDGVVYTEVAPVIVADSVSSTLHGRGYGAGMGPGVRYTTLPGVSWSSQRGTAGMGSVRGRIAQSLTDRTGVTLEATVRRTFGSVPPLLVTTPAGFFEDGVYDDPFASDGLFLEAGIKHVFASAAEVAASGWWANKDYSSASAFDASGVSAAGSALRSDRVTMGTVTWTTPLLSTMTGAVALSAEFGYRFIRHRSMDAYYNYTSHALSAGISVAY